MDFSHACEPLGPVAAAVYGPGSLRARDGLARQCPVLRHEGVTPIQDPLAALAPRTPEATDEGRRAGGYFATHAARLAYPAFRARCFPSGAGASERTAKNLIPQRQTRAGRRALPRSGRWTAFWHTQPQLRRRLPVRETALPPRLPFFHRLRRLPPTLRLPARSGPKAGTTGLALPPALHDPPN